MDHTSKANYALSKFVNCVTKVCKLMWFLRKESNLECCLVKKLLMCCCHGCFVKSLTRKIEKDLQLIWPLKYDTVFRTWSSLMSLNFFASRYQSSPVLKMTGARLPFYKPKYCKNTTVFKHCWPRISNTPISAFRNVSRPVRRFFSQELAIFWQFFA